MNNKKTTETAQLDRQTISELRQRAHKLKPVVQIGQRGLTDAVINELDNALAHHELVKIRIAGADREARAEVVQSAAGATKAAVIQSIGSTATLYRKNPDK